MKKLTDEKREKLYTGLTQTIAQARESVQALSIDAIAQYLTDASAGINAMQTLSTVLRNDAGLDYGRWSQWLQTTVNVIVKKDGAIAKVKGRKNDSAPALKVPESGVINWWSFQPAKAEPDVKLQGLMELDAALAKWEDDNLGKTREVDKTARKTAKVLREGLAEVIASARDKAMERVAEKAKSAVAAVVETPEEPAAATEGSFFEEEAPTTQ